MPVALPPSLVGAPARTASKTIAFTGAAGNGAVGAVAVFTTTGSVLIQSIAGFCTVSLTTASSPTLALGVTGSTSLFLAATATSNITSTNNLWLATTATVNGLALPAALTNIVVGSNVILTVAVATISTGTLEIDALWLPLSGGSSLA